MASGHAGLNLKKFDPGTIGTGFIYPVSILYSMLKLLKEQITPSYVKLSLIPNKGDDLAK
jgi:hypothetical protein